MKTVTKTAFANLKENKSRNILTGIAIALTTLLIYTVLSFGFGMIKLQREAVNTIYPTFHVMYRNVKEDTVNALRQHADIKEIGKRSDIGQLEADESEVVLIYLDRKGFELNKLKLSEGNYPAAEDEIAVTKGALKALGLTGEVGDFIDIPYQVYEDNGLGVEKKGSFKISGILPDIDPDTKRKIYSLFVSEKFLNKEISTRDIRYRIMIHFNNAAKLPTDDIEEKAKEIAENFGIAEGDTVINTEYLWANYVDPSFNTGIALIVLVVVFAGFITIYSIYYVSTAHKVKEYGKLKAMGATKKQFHQIVFREGMLVSLPAIPAGLLLGINVNSACFKYLMDTINDTTDLSKVMAELVDKGRVSLFNPLIAAAAIGISIFTVIISLVLPMRKAGKISPVEAMRYENQPAGKKETRSGYANLSILRLTKANLSRNRKRTIVTVITLGATGILFVVVSTVLSCAKPTEIAKDDILSDFRISIDPENDNKEHPERDWKNIQQNNPLDDSFEKQVLNTVGVKKLNKLESVSIELKDYTYDGEPWYSSIIGLGEEFADELEKGQIKGKVFYKELQKGDKIILSKSFLHWHPETKVGDTIKMIIENGSDTIDREFVIAAIGDYSNALTHNSEFVLPSSVIETMCDNNMTYSYEITADEKMYDKVKINLKTLIDSQEFLLLDDYKSEVKTWENTMGFMSKAGYVFMIILAGVGIMNLINTMVNSVYTRKRELGIMQAIGLSDRQLIRMLQAEGLFYTAGTLLVSLGVGNLAGYGFYRYAVNNGVMGITKYHYPFIQTIYLIIAVLVIQMALSALISRSFNKQSLIDRVRFSE